MSHRILLAVMAAVVVPLTASAQNQKLEIVKLADGVLVLDSGRTPDSARTMMSEIRKLTDTPIRVVLNSHWHDDHISPPAIFSFTRCRLLTVRSFPSGSSV